MIIDDEATHIDRIENVKLKSRKFNHKQSMKKTEKYEFSKKVNKEKRKQEWLPFIIIDGCLITMVIISFIITSIYSNKNLSPSNYNKIELGMTYEECQKILGIEGYRVKETKMKLFMSGMIMIVRILFFKM